MMRFESRLAPSALEFLSLSTVFFTGCVVPILVRLPSLVAAGRTQIDLLGSLRPFIQPSSYALSRSTGLIWTAPSPSPPRATSLLTCYPACFSEAVIPAYIYRLALTALCRSSVRFTVRRTSRAKKVLEFGRISSRTSPVVLYDLFLASRLGNVSGECY